MYGDSPVTGHSVQGSVPEWQPLLEAVGEDLAGTFMWMFEVRLSDGRPLHAYKHIDTRCYVHLDPASNAFRYVGEHHYRRVELADALEAALSPWWERLNASVEDIAASWIAIARAREPGERHPGRAEDA
jgi:hypothetical protein